MLGIGMAYHRLLTHRGYKTYKCIEYFLTMCGALALEGGPIFWVATHRIHHQKSDREGDPHTPREGTWWAHMGWVMTGQGLHHDASVLARYAPDLSRDRFHVWLSSWHWISNIVVGLVLLVFGGIPYVLWGIFFRTTWGLHSTWLVNSATHKWGSRRFQTRDDSTNNWWVALLTFGEGWHNNHHAHPTSARHGLAWYEIDLNYIGISLLRMCGLAWDVRLARIAQPVPHAENERLVLADEAMA
jgi:stearoyl-CoA desaturase (delta-9 desaturase)